jgi:hypothetical protein
MESGGVMKNINMVRIALLIGIMLLCIPLFAQQNKNMQDILSIINETKAMPNFGNYIDDYLVSKLSQSDIPLIYDLVCDKTISFSMREKLARVAASLKPEKKEIERVINIALQYLPEYENPKMNWKQDLAGPIMQTIDVLYNNANDDVVVLKPFRDFYFNSACRKACKDIILSKLRKTDAPQNHPLYNKILNDPNSTDSQKQLTAIGLTKLDSLKSIPYLREMSEYLFASDNNVSNAASYIAAIDLLGQLGKKHYEASKEIQEVIDKVCNYDANKYGYMLKIPENVHDLFIALQINPGEGNRKYLERLLDNECKYPDAKKYAIMSLGSIGNEETIRILEKYIGLYPNEVNKAITNIKKEQAN